MPETQDATMFFGGATLGGGGHSGGFIGGGGRTGGFIGGGGDDTASDTKPNGAKVDVNAEPF